MNLDSALVYPTSFDQLIGNEAVKRYLNSTIQNAAVGHAFLFSGPEGVGKSLFARAFAAGVMAAKGEKEQIRKLALGIHPDLHVLQPEGKVGLHSIESLRRFGEEVYYPPYESLWKVFIIDDADKMSTYSANALLKTFEEPPENTLIILLTNLKSSLLPTILSRCRIIHFSPIEERMIKDYLVDSRRVEEKTATLAAYLAEGSISRALAETEELPLEIRCRLLNLLAQGKLGSFRLLSEAAETIAKLVQKAREEEEGRHRKLDGGTFSVSQKEQLEKEAEGRGAILTGRLVNSLFATFQSWFRDLELLRIGGTKKMLLNPDFHAALEQEVQRGEVYSLKEIEKLLGAVGLSFKRFTPLSICLETLFLACRRI